MKARYYLVRSLDSGQPILLHRFFTETERTPESAGYARPSWQPNKSLRAKLTMGEIDDDDLISEAEAAAILTLWSSYEPPSD